MITKKGLTILFFCAHLILIFFQGFWTTIDMFWDVHYNRTINIPLLNFFRINQATEPYYAMSGIETGYGFYGIRTATKKYFRITYYDSSYNELKRDRFFTLSTSNGISRMESYANYMANYIADTDILTESDTKNIDSLEAIELRQDYVTKSLKWQGKREASIISDCTSYRIELLTIVPRNIWEENRQTKPELYVIQDEIFTLQ